MRNMDPEGSTALNGTIIEDENRKVKRVDRREGSTRKVSAHKVPRVRGQYTVKDDRKEHWHTHPRVSLDCSVTNPHYDPQLRKPHRNKCISFL